MFRYFDIIFRSKRNRKGYFTFSYLTYEFLGPSLFSKVVEKFKLNVIFI